MNDQPTLIQALTQTHRTIKGLVESLTDDELSVPYHPGINPPVWELGHTAHFFEVFILRPLDGAAAWSPGMDDIWDSFNIDHRDRWTPGIVPNREDTIAYVDAVHDAILSRMAARPPSPVELYLYRYAIYHQSMHIESLLWCRQTLGYKEAGYGEAICAHDGASAATASTAAGTSTEDVVVEPGVYRIGVLSQDTYGADAFAFDNEKPGFDIELDAFRISPTLVSNREYLAFVEDGGYERPEFWSWGGKKWLATPQAAPQLTVASANSEPAPPKQPLYWRREQGVWLERYFSRWLPLVMDYPVKHINYWEAEAYCRWAARRLPTEYEWEVAALGNRAGAPCQRYPWGNGMESARVDMDGERFARVPVTAFPEGSSPAGCRQMIGTLWEWTSSQFLPYNGFSVDMYPYMSTLQFGDHKTARGGSCATYSELIRGTYRQAYSPERNDVFIGFRTCAL
jgi:iron(II)-dependent oxidoreductase